MKNLLKAVLFAGVALGGIVVSTLIVNYFKELETPQIRPIVECPATSQGYQATISDSGQNEIFEVEAMIPIRIKFLK